MRKCLSTSLLLVFAAGCADFTPPEGYVKDSNNADYDFKAVSARGNAIGLKKRPNEDASANLKFWTDAVEHQKVDIDGMKLIHRDSINSAGGIDGTLFHFELGEGQSRITYLIALYVTPSTIYTIEATGPAAEIEPELPAIKTSMQSLRT